MNKTERELAERSISDLTEVVERLHRAHELCKALSLDYGWDLEYDDIAEVGMRVSRIALGIVDSIAEEDKWNIYWSKKDV